MEINQEEKKCNWNSDPQLQKMRFILMCVYQMPRLSFHWHSCKLEVSLVGVTAWEQDSETRTDCNKSILLGEHW